MKTIMNPMKLLDLQLFADAGTLVNATGNYVNAGTGATTNFSGNNTLSAELKTFYDTELLENARMEMFYAQFGRKQPLPANKGKSVEWRKSLSITILRLVEVVASAGTNTPLCSAMYA